MRHPPDNIKTSHKMEVCVDHSKPLKNVSNLDYLLKKCLWCLKYSNNNSCIRLSKYIGQIIQLSTTSYSLDHLFYVNDIIEYLAEHFLSKPKYVCYLKRILILCLMPPTVKSITECSVNLSILIRFYNVMAKSIWLVHTHAELSVLLLGVIQSSVLRCRPVPENSVDLRCCYKAIETSDLPKTLMKYIQNAPNHTFLGDVLKLTYNIAAVSDESVLQMLQSDGIRSLVCVLNPEFLSMPVDSFERLTACEFVILLLTRMIFSLRHKKTVVPPNISRNILEIIFCNIKIETEKNVLSSMKIRNDFCYILGEFVDNCSIDEHAFSNEMIIDIVMLSVWPEIIRISHWLDNVTFNFVNENFIFKSIMIGVMNKVFINSSQKIKFQQLNTFLIQEFIILSNIECTKNTYGDYIHDILNRLLLSLPYLLLNSIENPLKKDCCIKLLTLIKSLKSQECFSSIMVNAIICIGIVSNDDYDILRELKSLSTDVLINSVILDALKINNYICQDIILSGLNALNIFFRENQYNPEVQTMVFNMIMGLAKSCIIENDNKKINQNILLDLLHFIKYAIIQFNDQLELFVKAEGIELLLDILTSAKYPIQLVILTTLVEIAVLPSVKTRIKKWKSAKTNQSYLELMCEIWRHEQVRFNFIEDDFMFEEQKEKTTENNLSRGCSPAVESMFLYAQPKIYLLLQLVEFFDEKHEECWFKNNSIKENTIKACRLVSNFQDKVTIAHIYHYYSFKLGEIWNENEIMSHDPDNVPSSIELQSIDIMTVRYAYLMALIKMIKSKVTNLEESDSDIELENKLYEEIRRHHSNSHKYKSMK